MRLRPLSPKEVWREANPGGIFRETFALPCLTTQQLPPTKKSSFQPKAATISVLLRWSRGTEANANVPYSQFDLGVIES